MSQEYDEETAYGHDQDRGPSKTGDPARPEDLNPDDFGPETEDGPEINPSTGVEYGEIDQRPDSPPR